MSDNAISMNTPSQQALNGYRDARQFVKLLQCSICSRLLQSPITLPCGNVLCRSCLPASHIREHVTYPAFLTRRQATTCPFECTYQVHPVDDCSVDVVFGKLLDVVHSEIVRYGTLVENIPITLEEVPNPNTPLEMTEKSQLGDPEKASHTHRLTGGRLVSAYTLAKKEDLPYTYELKFEPTDEDETGIEAIDSEALRQIQDVSQKELDCHVCYNLMLDPITTPCGHTFCRKCLARILDHSNLCPVCRRNLPLPSSLSNQSNNKRLTTLINSLYPDQISGRLEAVDLEERSAPGGLDTALFVVTVAFPQMPMLLHVFEPRYRLMIRRALQGNGQFGMVAHNEHGVSQGQLGRIPFMQYGVMVQVEDYHVLPDGRSLLQCRGVSRIRVLGHGMLDGYVIGRVEKIEDISLPEEERMEQEETSTPAIGPEDPSHLDRMSTAQLYSVVSDFVQRGRERSPQWLQPRIMEVYGSPPTDPAIFPYWFASVLPLHPAEKYKLLPTTSVRERLKITARWVHKIDAQRW